MFDHWTLKKKLVTTFATLLTVAGAVIVTAVVNNAKLRDTTAWNTHTYQVLEQAQGMLLNMVNIETGMRGFVASGDERFLEPLVHGKEAFGKHFDQTKSLTSDNPTQQGRLDKLQAAHLQFLAVADALIQLRRDVSAGKSTAADMQKSFAEGRDKEAMDGFRAGIAEFMKTEADLLDKRAAELASTSTATTYTLILGGLTLCALTALAGLALTRSLFKQLGAEPADALDVVGAMAQGDLSVSVRLQPGDTTSLMAKMADMRDSLSTVVAKVRTNAESVATASAQIAQGNTDLSQRTEEQSSALQETAATMHELGTTVRNNADNAKQANQLAQGASTVAAKGGEVVGQVVETMKGINDSSKKIADIIAVIDGIAFQTNILALNAAVEAARAGEQGRGFAVVASEVRSLAQRSAGAAKEIKTLISSSVEQVDLGTTLVDQAGQTMAEIVTAIGRVSDIVGEISAASVEQSTGVGQIGQAITQMDQTTQQNAALVEQSAAAAESLRHQASQMVDVVAVFRVSSRPGQVISSRVEPTQPSPIKKTPLTSKTVSRIQRQVPQLPAPAPLDTARTTHTTNAESWETF